MKEKSNASALSFPMLVGVSAPSGERVCSQIRSCLLPDSDASAPRFADKDRARKGGLGVRGGRLKSKTEVGREATAPLKGRVFKIGISKVSGSVLAAEICTGPHNRLLRRQHCSSLCSQSELQCFAPGLRQKSARCPLQRCHIRHAICLKNAQRLFLILNTLPFKGGCFLGSLTADEKRDAK